MECHWYIFEVTVCVVFEVTVCVVFEVTVCVVVRQHRKIVSQATQVTVVDTDSSYYDMTGW